MPGISHHSKAIKKRKEAPVTEEGEEANDSDQALEDEERAPAPLGDLEKFPEYIELHLKP